jgi:hypothetical protein
LVGYEAQPERHVINSKPTDSASGCGAISGYECRWVKEDVAAGHDHAVVVEVTGHGDDADPTGGGGSGACLLFDDAMLTNGDRGFLARKWGVPHWHWWDTARALAAGSEDGLEAMFAELYRECAWGHDTRFTSYTLPEPPGINGPSIGTGSFDICAYLRRIADQPLAAA